MDFSMLISGNPRDFADNLNKVNEAHNIVNDIRELIWQGEATLNLRIKFEKLGLKFENTMTNEDLLRLMNDLDSKLMIVRVSIRTKNNKGVGHFNDKTKYINGFVSELLNGRVDLSVLTIEGAIDIESIEYENIEQMHTEIMKLRELIWVEAMKEFKGKLVADGIELGSEASRCEDFFEVLDKIDLKLQEIRISKDALARNQNSLYTHGQASTISSVDALQFALGTAVTPRDISEFNAEGKGPETSIEEKKELI